MRTTLYEYCVQTGSRTLLDQWDAEKNAPLTPKDVTGASSRKFWWRCPRGHSYAASVAARTYQSNGYPYCAGQRALAGFNDLASQEPEIAKQWHPSLNAPLTPDQVTRGSRKKAWWICSEGHVWKAAVYSRTGRQKSGCPVCAGKIKMKNSGRRVLYEETGRAMAAHRGADFAPVE